MRQAAVVPGATHEIRRVIVFDTGASGTYLFLFRSLADEPAFADHWYESAADAISSAELAFGIHPGEWQAIDDPQPGCQHDRVAPVRD